MKLLLSAVSTLFAIAILHSAPLGQTSNERGSTEAKLKSVPPVVVPESAKTSGLGGIVNVRVKVDAKGIVTSVESINGPGWLCPDVKRPDVLAVRQASEKAAKLTVFTPATKNGKPIKSSMFLSFSFPERKPEKPKATDIAKAEGAGDSKPEKPSEGRDPNDYTFTGPVTLGDRNYQAVGSDKSPPPDYTGPVSSGAGERSVSDPSGTSHPRPISGGVLNGRAKSLPRPNYPPAAKAVRVSGAVTTQVVIDEAGEIFSAEPVSGHPLLRHAARMAACGAKFTPTLLMGQPVKVSGIIVYMFNL